MKSLILFWTFALFTLVSACCSTSIAAATPAKTPLSAEAEDVTSVANQVLVSPSMQETLMYALSMIGVKYRYGGNNAETGFDCSGFVRHVFAETLSLPLPRSAQAMSKFGQHIEKENLQPGDLVFYKTLKRSFSHVGLYIGEGRFVHAPSRGKTVEIVDMNDHYWRQRFNGARRVAKAIEDANNTADKDTNNTTQSIIISPGQPEPMLLPWPLPLPLPNYKP